MPAVGIVATLVVQEGKGAEFEEIFKDLQKQVKANEDGCLLYDLYKSKANPNAYVVMERYKDDEALKVHGGSEYFKAAFGKFGGMLDGAPSIEILDPVE